MGIHYRMGPCGPASPNSFLSLSGSPFKPSERKAPCEGRGSVTNHERVSLKSSGAVQLDAFPGLGDSASLLFSLPVASGGLPRLLCFVPTPITLTTPPTLLCTGLVVRGQTS